MTDSFYTPLSLSQRLANSIIANDVHSMADFSIGGGDLIKTLLPKYPDAEVFGVDISENEIKELKKQYTEWHLAVCDFLDGESRNSVDFLNGRSFDLIVQNPPFTCKGSTVYNVVFEGRVFRVSIAMKFLLTALKYLSEKGGAYAIMPISCVHSQKDSEAWSYLKDHYNACVLEEPERFYFSKKCSPSIVLAYAGRYQVECSEKTVITPFKRSRVKRIVRGGVKMQNLAYSKSEDALPLVHTTNMQKGLLVRQRKVVGKCFVEGPGVLIPRVCNPNPDKVVLLDEGVRVVLSDCVFFLQTDSREDATELIEMIHFNWNDFERLYKGTGARYTTILLLCEAFGVCGKSMLMN